MRGTANPRATALELIDIADQASSSASVRLRLVLICRRRPSDPPGDVSRVGEARGRTQVPGPCFTINSETSSMAPWSAAVSSSGVLLPIAPGSACSAPVRDARIASFDGPVALSTICAARRERSRRRSAIPAGTSSVSASVSTSVRGCRRRCSGAMRGSESIWPATARSSASSPASRRSVRASVTQKSWFDGEDCIAIDYPLRNAGSSPTGRDEIREVGCGLYLARPQQRLLPRVSRVPRTRAAGVSVKR